VLRSAYLTSKESTNTNPTGKRQVVQTITQFFASPDKASPPTQTTLITPPTTLRANQYAAPQPTNKNKGKASETVEKHSLQPFRIMIAIKVEKHETKTPNELIFEQVKNLFSHYLRTNGVTSILPWRTVDMNTHPSINDPKDLPTKMSEFKMTYAEGLRPKSNSTCWFKLHI
jgi:hypothetical protein